MFPIGACARITIESDGDGVLITLAIVNDEASSLNAHPLGQRLAGSLVLLRLRQQSRSRHRPLSELLTVEL